MLISTRNIARNVFFPCRLHRFTVVEIELAILNWPCIRVYLCGVTFAYCPSTITTILRCKFLRIFRKCISIFSRWKVPFGIIPTVSEIAVTFYRFRLSEVCDRVITTNRFTEKVAINRIKRESRKRQTPQMKNTLKSFDISFITSSLILSNVDNQSLTSIDRKNQKKLSGLKHLSLETRRSSLGDSTVGFWH